jgi:galactitol-specific phosphotransferase system IIC component
MTRRYKKDRYNEFQPENSRYDLAYKRVKRIKGFYIHLMVYVIVNAFIIVSKYYKIHNVDTNFWHWEILNTAFFWGIGLLAHGLSVFGRNVFFGSNWEEKKIKEFMDKENKEKWE